MAPPLGDASRQARGVFLPSAFASVAALFAALCLFYTARFHHFGTVNDLWFGADVWRHVAWASDPSEAGRWQLHPGAFVLFRAWGHLLRGAGLEPQPDDLLWFSLPGIALVALALVLAAERLARGVASPAAPWAALAILMAIGPAVAFAPMPESHVLGGAALLLQAVCVLGALGGAAETAVPAEPRRLAWGALGLGALAASFTLTNAMPAALMLWALPRMRRVLAWLALACVLAGGCLIAVHELIAPQRLVWALAGALEYELSLLTAPDPAQLGWSFQHLVLFQLGLPRTELITWTHPADGAVVTSIHSGTASPLQWVALALWIGAVAFWARRSRAAERTESVLAAHCAAALLALLAFHVPFSAWEAYIFSPHAWPYVVLPGVLAWRWAVRTRSRAVLACIAAAVALSAIQTACGLVWLENLPGDTGAVRG